MCQFVLFPTVPRFNIRNTVAYFLGKVYAIMFETVEVHYDSFSTVYISPLNINRLSLSLAHI